MVVDLSILVSILSLRSYHYGHLVAGHTTPDGHRVVYKVVVVFLTGMVGLVEVI